MPFSESVLAIVVGILILFSSLTERELSFWSGVTRWIPMGKLDEKQRERFIRINLWVGATALILLGGLQIFLQR